MEPIKFKGFNSEFAKDQPEYGTLPALKTEDGQVISCWKFTTWERIRILFNGRIWLHVHTFNRPLQPLSLTMEKPFKST